jgi:hypothetical protein
MPKGHSILARDAAEAWPSPTSALTAVVVGSSVGIGGGTRPICSARPQEMRSRAEPATAIVRLALPLGMTPSFSRHRRRRRLGRFVLTQCQELL